MPCGDPIEEPALSDPLGRLVARFPRASLQVATIGHLYTLDLELDPEPVAELGAEALVGVRLRPQAVVDVEADQGAGLDQLQEGMGQADRIGPAREHRQHVRAGLEQIGIPDRLLDALCNGHIYEQR